MLNAERIRPTDQAASTDFIPSPAQQIAIDKALRAMAVSEIVVIEGEQGTGRTSVLQELQRQRGGAIINSGDLMAMTAQRNPHQFEQVLLDLFKRTLAVNDIVYFDLVMFLQAMNSHEHYKRGGLIGAVLRVVRDILIAEGKCFVFSNPYYGPSERAKMNGLGRNWNDKGVVTKIAAFTPADYEHILTAQPGVGALPNVNFAELFMGSRKLSASQLALLGGLIRDRGLQNATNLELLAIVDAELLNNNVNLNEVEFASMDELIGVEGVAERIDRAILLPLREPALARELGLEPKHGILLHGPPGTGKTTIGRALAHKMKGKFFMIDGDFVHDGVGFHKKVDDLFEDAIRSSPSVIFVDDADVIMSDPSMQYFGRYLLTKLDGLAGESMAHVCVIMTAMNLASMPAALIRSGRLELWVEMTLPDAEIRKGMIGFYTAKLPFAPTSVVVPEGIADLTEGFTPADLRRVVADAAGRLGFDRHRGREEHGFDQYLLIAAASIRDQKQRAETAITARGGLKYY